MTEAATIHHAFLNPFLERLTDSEREAYEERAAIIEFDAQVQRQLAEAYAMLDLIRQIGWKVDAKPML